MQKIIRIENIKYYKICTPRELNNFGGTFGLNLNLIATTAERYRSTCLFSCDIRPACFVNVFRGQWRSQALKLGWAQGVWGTEVLQRSPGAGPQWVSGGEEARYIQTIYRCHRVKCFSTQVCCRVRPPYNVVMAENINIFKNRLDKFWSSYDFVYLFRAQPLDTGSVK